MTKKQFEQVKVGSIVKFRKDLIINNTYDGFLFFPEMMKNSGKIFKVKKLYRNDVKFTNDLSGWDHYYPYIMFDPIFKFGR